MLCIVQDCMLPGRAAVQRWQLLCLSSTDQACWALPALHETPNQLAVALIANNVKQPHT